MGTLASTRIAAAALAVLAVPVFGQIFQPQGTPPYAKKLAPYVSSPYRVVDRMLELANLRPGEKLYDLGCGDGRILISAAQNYNARAVGVEISERLVQQTKEKIQKLGLQGQVRVVQADLLNVDLSDADVVTIYLETDSNQQLRSRLEKFLKPGARVISHDYPVPGWKPKLVDKSAGHRDHLIYLYEMPPVKE